MIGTLKKRTISRYITIVYIRIIILSMMNPLLFFSLFIKYFIFIVH
jgi:hypothetical protein